jgi:hypothetical protein
LCLSSDYEPKESDSPACTWLLLATGLRCKTNACLSVPTDWLIYLTRTHQGRFFVYPLYRNKNQPAQDVCKVSTRGETAIKLWRSGSELTYGGT